MPDPPRQCSDCGHEGRVCITDLDAPVGKEVVCLPCSSARDMDRAQAEEAQPVIQWSAEPQPVIQWSEKAQPVIQWSEEAQPVIQWSEEAQPITERSHLTNVRQVW